MSTFIWDPLSETDGNAYHVMSQHPEMKSTSFVEVVFDTLSGDEDLYNSWRNRKLFLILEKTYQGRLYKIVFQKEGSSIRVKTAHPLKKRRKQKP